MYEQKIKTVIYAPGIYCDVVAQALAQRKYFFWEHGLRVVDMDIDLRGVLFKLGERIQIDIDDPDIDTDFVQKSYLKMLNTEL
jgi:hypothetical protein